MGTIKIADFGLAREFCIPFREYTHEVVTLWYRCPEILLGQRLYCLPVDMWSVGAIFAEMSNHKPLWPGGCEIDQLYKIFQVLGTPSPRIWKTYEKLPHANEAFPNWPKKPQNKFCEYMDDVALDLFQQMVHYEPAERIT